uniref:Conserved hypothetical chloroplast protein Ycf2 n=1 Tax=Selaginella pallidissima TaxID=1715389 RepID=A0A7U3W1D7_9TRAC|nr:conserved hypothetical chloroplast protein Ycf2 [Selaginella pallidissima]
MDEQSSVEAAGVKREIDKHCRGFWGVDWTLGSLTAAVPSNRKEHLPDPSHQFLVPNSPVLLLALPVLWEGCADGGGARGINRKPHHPLVLERERVCTVRTSRSGCEQGMHGRRSGSQADVSMNKPNVGVHTAAKPIQNIVGESKTSRGVSPFRYLRYFGRSGDGYRVFDVWATREYRNIRSDCSCAEPHTGSKNECSEQKPYLLACTNRCTCFPFQSAPRAVCGGYISHNDSIEEFRAVLDRSIPLKLSHNHRFVPQVHPAARDVLSGAYHVSVSIFGDRNRMNANLPIPSRIPPSASLTYAGGSEERLPGGIVREGFITTSWKKADSGDFRITGHGIGTVTNWRESSQSGIYRIRLNFNESVNVLSCPGRKSFCHPKTQIRIFRMGYEGFRNAMNQHPLNRRETSETNHWLNDRRSRGDGDKYVDLHPKVYEWSNNAGGSRVFAGYSMPRRNYSMTVYDRAEFTAGPDPIGQWGSSMKCVKFSFICERLNLMIHESEDADSPSDPTNNTMIFHLETNCGVSGNHKPSQSPDELEASSLSNNATVVDKSITGLPRVRNEPDEAGCVRRPSRDTTLAMPGRYNRFDPAKRIDMGSLTCPRAANTPRSPDHLQLGRRRRPSPPRIRNRVGGALENNSIAYRQSRNLLSVRAPTTSAEGRRLVLLGRRVISIIQSQISYYVLYPNHSQGRDRPFALARYARELLHLCSAQTNSLLFRGETKVGPTGNLSITKPFQKQRISNLGGITRCWPHACAKVIAPATGTGGCHDSRDGTGFSSSGPMRCRSRAVKGIGIQNKPKDTLYRTRKSSASSTDLSPIGRGGVAETAEFDSFEDDTSPKPDPPPRPNEPVEGAEMFVAKGGDNNAFEGYKLFRAYTPPRLPTRERWKYRGAIPEAFEENASPRGNDRTNIMNVRLINIDQSSCGPAIQWLSRNNCHNDEYPTMGLPPFALLVLGKGSSYIDPRKRLAVIRYLTDALRKYRSDRSMHWGIIHYSIGWRNRFYLSPPTNIKRPVKNIGYSIRTGERTNVWSDVSESLDLYPTVKALPIGFLITGANIYRNELDFSHNHHKNDSGHRIAQEQGLYYSRYLAEGCDNGIAHYPLHHSDSRNWVSLASWQRVTPPNYTCRIPPVQVRSGFSPSRGISPIGSAETGRSYPMNDLAADFDAHSIPISMSDLYEDERDLTMDDISMNGMRLLAASLCRFILVLGLTEKMPPCVIWIRDMHELDLKGERFARPVGTELAPRSFSISSAGFATCTPGTIVTGPTHPPGEMDPPLICANRLDRSTDVRALSILRRQKEFPAPPRSRRFDLLLENDNFYLISAFGYIIMCYYARDLASLAHEALLISISHSVVYGHAIGSVPLRQVIPDHDVCMGTGSNYSEEYVYRVGRAVAHSTVIGIIPTSPSSPKGGEMKDPPPDNKIECLPAWYSEPFIAESTKRGFTRLSRVSGSLAGSARYDWSIADDQRDDSNNSVRSAAEYDSTSVARGASENIVAECPRSETHSGGSTGSGEVGFVPCLQTRTPPPGTAWNAISVVPSPVLDEEGFGMTNDTTARAPAPCPRPVSNISDWVQTAASARGKRTLANHLRMNPDSVRASRHPLCYAYKRISSQRLSRMLEGAESRSESMPSKDRPGIPGVHIPIGCGIGYRQSDQSVLPTGKRFVWYGPPSRDCTFAFSHQPFMDQVELISDQGGSMPKGLHAVRGNNIGFCVGADQQSSAHDIDGLVPRVASAGESTAAERAAGIYSESAGRRQSAEMLERTDDIGFRSERTHLFHPVHSYQARAVFESPSDTFARSESPNHERWLEAAPNDPPTHSTLPESHRYSLKNTRVADRMPLHQAIGVCSKN